MANVEAGGVMGHIALSQEPPTKIKYGFDLEVRNGKQKNKTPAGDLRSIANKFLNERIDEDGWYCVGNQRLHLTRFAK